MAEEAQVQVREPRQLYARVMHRQQLAELMDDINSSSDRYDVTEELSIERQHLAALLKAEASAREKYPGREDVLLAIKAQQQQVIAQLVKDVKTARDIENLGQVFTVEKVAMLLDKVASIVMFRISDLRERTQCLDDISDIASHFRKSYERGTLVTPDHDALMMDDTVPNSMDVNVLRIEEA